MNESHFIKHEQCPKCSELGKDNNKDNLGVFSDGHKHCFSCGYHVSADGITKFKHGLEEQAPTRDSVILPYDADINYPYEAIEWIRQYDLNKNDLMFHNVVWSDSLQRLIFPVYGEEGLIAWQGRSFKKNNMALAKVMKWWGVGNLKDTFNILGRGEALVITEDIVSAIKVSKCGVKAMPLYGCKVGLQRFRRLYRLLSRDERVLVWLDPDKRTESVLESKLGRACGIECSPIFSECDPKEHTYERIRSILNENGVI